MALKYKITIRIKKYYVINTLIIKKFTSYKILDTLIEKKRKNIL
jgi:hypothetical protein